MRAAELVALAAAHGIDLPHVAGSASDTHGIARTRARTAEERRTRIPVRETVEGHESRVYRRPTWSHAEVGLGACRVPRMPWLAACYSFAGDDRSYPELHRGLMLEAMKLSVREGWSMYERDRTGAKRYAPIADLASLVLDIDRHRPMFTAAPMLSALCLGVPDEIWTIRWEPRYRALLNAYERWLGIAQGIIAGWLSDRDEDHVPQEVDAVA